MPRFEVSPDSAALPDAEPSFAATASSASSPVVLALVGLGGLRLGLLVSTGLGRWFLLLLLLVLGLRRLGVLLLLLLGGLLASAG